MNFQCDEIAMFQFESIQGESILYLTHIVPVYFNRSILFFSNHLKRHRYLQQNGPRNSFYT